MKRDKYVKLMQARVGQTVAEWSAQPAVAEQELHRFFHNLKGTGGTLGLAEVELYSGEQERSFAPDGGRMIGRLEWERHVGPLLRMFQGMPQELPSDRKQTVFEQNVAAGAAEGSNRVLLIDDDIEFVAYLKEVLEKHDYPVSIALDAERGLKLFYDWKPDLILLDIILPDRSGMEVLPQMVEKAKQELIPILMISADGSADNQIRAYRMGATDFLAKPFSTELLLALTANRLAMKRDWQRSIIVDELTGAYNRKHFNVMVRQGIDDYNRNGAPFTLVLIDLDHFKKVNDTYGHLKGDEVLQAFVATAKRSIRKQNILCRYGGEEFALLLPGCGTADAVLIVEDMREGFNSLRFQSGGESFRVTFSSGLAGLHEANKHPEKLVDEADQALYSAKRSGRDRSVVYAQGISAAGQEAVINVVVVDDDPLMRELILDQFSQWKPAAGKRVSAFAYPDGTAFLASGWYREGEKYIVLLDGAMPELDGFEVLDRLRAGFPEQHVWVVMLTARSQKADIVHALQKGADDYVVKPFDMQELFLRIERLANRI
ncbi:diguanylate cyclase [Paenibacillus sp. N4]|uniref:GGDEF domain-containing response regulator n=1 Tax=Paenibacillus vietnamensis TaxID=2590547 RepID=UPI001CD11FD6|nr:diguanylate cyclase [Paenibacillus vietnamensis]MCA0754309.1 diguanylate cyclase [Paenibacillus vietnamensis]